MTIDLAALEDPALAGFVQSIPLNVDPFPYADLQAQGRYPIQSTPDTIPQMLAYLAGVDAENGQSGRVGYIDNQHRLLVHDPSAGAGGGATPTDLISNGVGNLTLLSLGYNPLGNVTAGTIGYGIAWTAFWDGVAPTANNGSMYLEIGLGDGIAIYCTLAVVPMYEPAKTTAPWMLTQCGVLWFSQYLLVTSAFPSQIAVNSGVSGIQCAANLIKHR